MPNIVEEQKKIGEMLAEEKLHDFVRSNLKQSLPDIGFSEELIRELTENLRSLNVQEFIRKHKAELDQVFTVGFFQEIVPAYFEKQVLPEIPRGRKFLDVGCGTGILLKRLEKTGEYGQLIGIDVLEYPEWKTYQKPNLEFRIVKDEKFPSFIKEYKPDALSITWTLHHMEFGEQEEYLEAICDSMKPGSTIVVLEDAYSEKMLPENGREKFEALMQWDKDDRRKIMSVYDWIANRVLAQRENVNIPLTYRTMEEWIELFEKIGFKCVKKKFIGFPDKRDINTPQGLMVFEK